MLYEMTTPENELIWLRPEPGGRRPRLSREHIAAAALRIADAEGFEAVTMKRIATELGVGTMTLYYYVRTKSDILALMHDAILADIIVPEPDSPYGWRDALTAISRATRNVMLEHAWSLASLDDAQFGPNAMRHYEQSLAALAHTTLSASDKIALLTIVDDYVVGNAVHSAEALSRSKAATADPTLVADAIAFGSRQLETGSFPHLKALYDQQMAGSDQNAAGTPSESPAPAMEPEALAEQFELGLQSLLDGLTTRMRISEPAVPAETRS